MLTITELTIPASKLSCNKHKTSLDQMALSWVLKGDTVTSVLIGTSNKEQILDNIKIINRSPFSKKELDEIAK